MRPGTARHVPANTVVTLFTSAAMNAATVAGALNVTDNGVVVSGTVQLFSSGQAIQFTPGTAFNPGDVIQVFLNSTALSADNVALSSFSGQFTVAGSPANTKAVVQAVNPFASATNVPLNTIIQVEYNQALLASTLNNTSVTLYQYSTGTYLTPTISLVGTQVINIAPTSNLVAGSQYQVYVSPNNAVTNTDGLAVQAYRLQLHRGHGDGYRRADDRVGGADQQGHQHRHQRVGIGELQQGHQPGLSDRQHHPVERRLDHGSTVEHQLQSRLHPRFDHSAGSAAAQHGDDARDQRCNQRGGQVGRQNDDDFHHRGAARLHRALCDQQQRAERTDECSGELRPSA